jgi:hypothetical protein
MRRVIKRANKEFLEQPGGVYYINYRHYEVGAPLADLKQVIRELKEMPGHEREVMMASVNRALAEAQRRDERGRMNHARAIKMAQDVTVWFANEVVEERAVAPP